MRSRPTKYVAEIVAGSVGVASQTGVDNRIRPHLKRLIVLIVFGKRVMTDPVMLIFTSHTR